jgi:hypothetical protein
MPEVRVYIEAARATPDLVDKLSSAIKQTVGGTNQRDYTIDEKNVWPHIIGTLNPGHVTVQWTAHITSAERNSKWIGVVSNRLARIICDTLVRHGFPKTLQVCVDGDLRDQYSQTSFAAGDDLDD